MNKNAINFVHFLFCNNRSILVYPQIRLSEHLNTSIIHGYWGTRVLTFGRIFLSVHLK